ncbi:hypothetical protein CVT24_001466 [Panaeolus cyanescens]|uniref:Uncharacterized protein n=1 Tax=Panaeolus cyanescens TaxID=181874 RepID=A0A409VTC2_9AGAR|nr:hypothetical protein CVT24_001466 [Panaeolus cyanescens]
MAYSHSVDDNDPRITYSTAWDFITDDIYTMPQWSGTAHSTSTIGTTARLRFTGSAIAVICIIPTSGGGNGVSRASFSIDNGPAKEVHIPTTLPVQFEVEFWNSGPLPFGPHSLVITNIGNDAYFRLDRIDYDPTDSHAPRVNPPPQQTQTVTTQTQSAISLRPSNTPSSVTSVPPASSSESTSRSVGGSSRSISSVSATNSVSNLTSASLVPSSASSTVSIQQHSDAPIILGGGSNGSGASSAESQAPIAAIVGGTLGGLLILLFVVFVIVVRRRRTGTELQRLSDVPDTATTPFDAEPSHRMIEGSSMASIALNSTPASKTAMLAMQRGITPNDAPHQPLINSPQSGQSSDIYASSSDYSTGEPSIVGNLTNKESPASVSTNRDSAGLFEAPPPAYRNRQSGI